MSSPQSLSNGIAAAIIGCLITIIFFFAFALPLEKMFYTFESIGIFDVPAEWDSYDRTLFWKNLAYIVIILPALLGIVTMFMSAIRTQEYDVLDEDEVEAPPPQYYIPQEPAQ